MITGQVRTAFSAARIRPGGETSRGSRRGAWWMVAGAVLAEFFLLPYGGAILLGGLLICGTVVPWLARHTATRAAAETAPLRGELAMITAAAVAGLPELTLYGAVAGHLGRVQRAERRLRSRAERYAWTTGVAPLLITLIMGGVLACTATAGEFDVGPRGALALLTPVAAFAVMPYAIKTPSPFAAGAVVPAPAGAVASSRPRVPRGPYLLRVAADLAYLASGEPVNLDAADLLLPPGRKVAVLAHDDAAASALAGVLGGELAYRGSVTLNGVELSDMARDDIRRSVEWRVCGTRRIFPGRRPSSAEGEPVLIIDERDRPYPEATLARMLADPHRSVLLLTRRAEFPGADPVLRLADEVITLQPGDQELRGAGAGL